MAVLGDIKGISLSLLDGVIGDLNPKNSNVYNLGTSSLKWSNVQATTFNGYTLAAACAKGVVTSIDTSANLPTSNAVKTFVENKGYITASHTSTYSHPTHTAYSSGLYKVTVNSLGHVTAASAVTKADITGLGIPGSDTDNDTKNTAGSTDTSSKIFLIGATSQAANPQTYSHDTAYVGTDGCLYSNSTKVSVEGHSHDYSSTYAAKSHDHSQIITVGDKRSEATTPNSYSNKIIFQGLKNKATIGNPSTDTYSYLVGLRGWSDSSGGKSHELAFNDSSINWRIGSTTAWEDWYKLLSTKDFNSTTSVGTIGSNKVYAVGVDANGKLAVNVPWETSTDTKVNVKARGTTKAYLLGTTTSPTSSDQAVTSVAETGVYFDTTAGYLVATKYNGLTLTAASTGFTIAGGTTSKTLTVSNTYTLGAACAKGVTDNTSNADVTSSDQNLITGRTLYYQLAKKGYTTNTGTVTSITLTQGTGISIGSSGTAITTSGSRTISLATITKSDSTSTASPSHGGTFTAVDAITYDSYGRVTGVNTKTVTLPSDSNTDTKVTQAYSTANASHPLLFSAISGINSTSSRGDTTAILNNQIYGNPSTGVLATKILEATDSIKVNNWRWDGTTVNGHLSLIWEGV